MSEPSFLAGRFLPHRILPDWLGETEAARLLAFSLAAETRFVPTRLNDHGGSRRESLVRDSLVLKDLGAFAAPLRRRALALQAGLETAFGLSPAPANSTQISSSTVIRLAARTTWKPACCNLSRALPMWLTPATTSAPPATSASRIAGVAAGVGSPAVTKHTSAGCPLANAAESRALTASPQGARRR